MGAKMFDKYLYDATGIDKDGNPTRVESNRNSRRKLKIDFLQALRVIDEQDFIGRYKWYNIPLDLSSEEIERILYYKGQVIFFYFAEIEKFCIMPFALDGGIDFYGRYNKVHPIPLFDGGKDDKKPEYQEYARQKELLQEKKLNVIYDIVDKENMSEEELKDLLTNSCVILRDYTPQIPINITPRAVIQQAILDVESDILPFMRTNLIVGTGIMGMRVADADARKEAEDLSAVLYDAALSGEPLKAITSAIETQDIMKSGNTRGKVEEYLMSLQSIDNLRLRMLGLDNGGLYEKKAHMLESEMNVNGNSVDGIYTDGLCNRQTSANIINSIWDLGFWAEPKESAIQVDLDGDGLAVDGKREEANQVQEENKGEE